MSQLADFLGYNTLGFLSGNLAERVSTVHHGNYDDYGGRNGEYSADTGAAIAYRHFKDVFQKVVNYVDKLIVAMEKDIKDAETKVQSSQ